MNISRSIRRSGTEITAGYISIRVKCHTIRQLSDSWKHDGIYGYASYKVADNVKTHEAWGIGIYNVFYNAPVIVDNAIETPASLENKIHHKIIFWLNGNKESVVKSIINGKGGSIDEKNSESNYGLAGSIFFIVNRKSIPIPGSGFDPYPATMPLNYPSCKLDSPIPVPSYSSTLLKSLEYLEDPFVDIAASIPNPLSFTENR